MCERRSKGRGARDAAKGGNLVELGLMPKLRFARAAEAVAGLSLSDDAKPVLKAAAANAATPAALVSALLGTELYADAIRVLAMALPRREAAWWACLAAREALSASEKPDAEAAALAAAEAWVFKPTEENRRPCFPLAQALEFATPAAYAAMAAYWSGGSPAPPDAPVVIPPGDALTGTAAGAAVLLAAAREPAAIKQRYKAALEQAVDIANGGNGRRA